MACGVRKRPPRHGPSARTRSGIGRLWPKPAAMAARARCAPDHLGRLRGLGPARVPSATCHSLGSQAVGRVLEGEVSTALPRELQEAPSPAWWGNGRGRRALGTQQHKPWEVEALGLTRRMAGKSDSTLGTELWKRSAGSGDGGDHSKERPSYTAVKRARGSKGAWSSKNSKKFTGGKVGRAGLGLSQGHPKVNQTRGCGLCPSC